MLTVADVNFTVTATAKQTVAVTEPMQEHRLPLSNLDLLLPPLDVNVFFCYENNDNKSVDDKNNYLFKRKVSVLKKSLARSLAYFYPFAGEIVSNIDGEPEILCNNRGVEFVEAYADVKLDELNLYKPDESVEGKLVPKKKEGVLSIQVTELKCGAMMVACAFDHRVADAYSANMFWTIWAQIASSKPISQTPLFQRALLSPRDPNLCNWALIDNMYVPISSLPPPSPSHTHHSHPLVTRIYHVSNDQLCHIQALANCNDTSGGCKGKKRVSKLMSFGAFLWQIIASHACQMGHHNRDKITKMGIVVDGRKRLCDGETQEKAKTLASYFGNVLSIPFGEEKCGDIRDKPLTDISNLVHDFMQGAITKDHFLDLVDWVELNRPDLAMTRIYCTKAGDGPAFVLSSGLGFPITEVDFGWGKPTFGSYHFPWGGSCGYVMPMPMPIPNSSNKGDWIVYMHLYKEQLDFVEFEAPNVFKPFGLDLITT